MENPPLSRTESPSPTQQASPWILLVDDEPAILQLIGTVLGSQGWPVRVARNAEAAMALLAEAGPTPPSLLICDVLMPGIDGLEMARRIVSRLPKLKVIFISGHLADISWWPADLCEYRFVPKPFTNDQLATVVAEVLADREPAG